MTESPKSIAVINRSFWPFYAVVGEALLRFSEDAVLNGHKVSVIIQDHMGIKSRLNEAGRGKGIDFYPGKAITNSSSGIVLRVFDSLWFMCWVFGVLLKVRPKLVYISTDPPILVPFIVMIYSKLFSADYVYHLQDIHPEATNVVVPVYKWLFNLLQKIDCITMRGAKRLITLTNQMAECIQYRSGVKKSIYILDNPAISFEGIDTHRQMIKGFSFCGNAGRLQRIPLLVEAIEQYLEKGGTLKFAFAGSGVFSHKIRSLSEKYESVKYFGLISPQEAAQLNADYEWALLPIEDEVTKFAFPSKSSSYVLSGASILAVCGAGTSVADWVSRNKLGCVVEPKLDQLVKSFFDIENGFIEIASDTNKLALSESLKFDVFVENLNKIVFE